MSKKGEVYVTYENSTKCKVTGIYANKELAENDRKLRGDLNIIDTFTVEGYRGDEFNYPLNNECKYYNPHLETIRELISCLYCLEGCCCGGLAHIITDDNNLEDHHIEWVLKYCDEDENKERTERGLVKLICEELLKISIQERVLLFKSFDLFYYCDDNCENCPIHKGEYYA